MLRLSAQLFLNLRIDMWLLWFSLVLQSAFYAEAAFGTPYLQNSRLCQPWTCISSKLGIPNSLPPREEYTATLKALLPAAWHEAAERALEACYNNRQRNYVTTCPGQALLHCTVDNLIENCPTEFWRKKDGCYPVSSLAGTKNMFTQSRYKNLEDNLSKEKRPAWFMRNYFSSKCCDLPELISSTFVHECGFTKLINYYDHTPENATGTNFMQQMTTTMKPNGKTAHQLNSIEVTEKADRLKIVPLPSEKDLLQCCDLEGFIQTSWREDCRFKLSWDRTNRLTFGQEVVTTTSAPPTTTRVPNNDVRVVPLSCEKETCIFQKLNVITATGSVDTAAFSKLLDNFTSVHPTWMKAKARVLTQCLARPSQGYEAECEINKLLACTLDVLSENCPYASKQDVCRHSRQNNTVCQVSSSRYRPKNRRSVCGLPNLVSSDVLTECGVTSVSRTEYVPEPPVAKPVHGWRTFKYTCKDSTSSTICLMSKMGVLNKYSFMDYFKMKDRIRDFTSQAEWEAMTDALLAVFTAMPLYKEHCNSPKKLLNVLDAMLMTCPVSKRRNTQQCNDFFSLVNPANSQQITKEKEEQILQHFNHVYLPTPLRTTPLPSTLTPKKIYTYTETNPLLDFGVLNSTNIPPVETIDLRKSKQIPVILPVYMRLRTTPNSLDMDTSSLGNYKNGVFQSSSYLLHGKVPATDYKKSANSGLP